MKEGVTNLYFARHGRTRMNAEGTLQSHSDSLHSVLTVEGRAQAFKLKNRLSSIKFTHVYSSPMLRAIETAAIIADDPGEVIPLSGFRERNFGGLENQPYWESMETRHDFLVNHEKPGYQNIHGIETDAEIMRRLMPQLQAIAVAHLGMSTLFVTHSGIMRFLIHKLGNIPYEEVKELNIGEASFMNIRMDIAGNNNVYQFQESAGITNKGVEVRNLF